MSLPSTPNICAAFSVDCYERLACTVALLGRGPHLAAALPLSLPRPPRRYVGTRRAWTTVSPSSASARPTVRGRYSACYLVKAKCQKTVPPSPGVPPPRLTVRDGSHVSHLAPTRPHPIWIQNGAKASSLLFEFGVQRALKATGGRRQTKPCFCRTTPDEQAHLFVLAGTIQCFVRPKGGL
jgi:hypothetical protein